VALEDLYSSSTLSQQALFSRTFNTTGWHTIQLRVTGTKNPASANVLVKTDGFSFTF